jgi:hypothetical protein
MWLLEWLGKTFPFFFDLRLIVFKIKIRKTTTPFQKPHFGIILSVIVFKIILLKLVLDLYN